MTLAARPAYLKNFEVMTAPDVVVASTDYVDRGAHAGRDVEPDLLLRRGLRQALPSL
jgi:hypothetical protein